MFKHSDLHLPSPEFKSELTTAIIDLDHLRKKELGGSTPAHIFFQLKEIFHFLESLGSARIEGNRTTLAEYIETKITPDPNPREAILEIQNNEKVMNFIESYALSELEINHTFLKECHQIIVKDLDISKEGDKTPGSYRRHNVKITKSNHIPPPHQQVQSYMQELTDFINTDNTPQFDLLKTAITHHRFTWVHPFGNGNGRTVRALTYAMLIKQGFNIRKGRIINPTAVFCCNRDLYCDMLEIADKGDKKGLLSWAEYVLTGIKKEVDKVDKLADYNFLKSKILLPAIKFSLERQMITANEHKVLIIATENDYFQANDIKHLFPENTVHTEISRFIRKMKNKKLIKSITPKARKYTLEIANGYLLRGVMRALENNNFIPIDDKIE